MKLIVGLYWTLLVLSMNHILTVTDNVYQDIVLILESQIKLVKCLQTIIQIVHYSLWHQIYIVGHHQVKGVAAFQVSAQPF